MLLIQILRTSLPLFYGLVSVNYLVYFVRQAPFAKRSVTPLLGVTLGMHLLYTTLMAIHYERQPIVGLSEALSIVSLGLAIAYLYAERLQDNKFTGAFILPMVAAIQMVSTVTAPSVPPTATGLLKNSLFGLHALIAIVGYSGFALGAVYAAMYLLLYRALKKNLFGLVFQRLPSLDSLAYMGFWAVCLGWLALTLAISLGVAMSLGAIPQFYADPKFISTALVWTVYGGVVLSHFVLGWHGSRSVLVSLLGFALAVAALISSHLTFSSFHTFQS
jgi:ABC-type uncharacterized transport system permease subunit